MFDESYQSTHRMMVQTCEGGVINNFIAHNVQEVGDTAFEVDRRTSGRTTNMEQCMHRRSTSAIQGVIGEKENTGELER